MSASALPEPDALADIARQHGLTEEERVQLEEALRCVRGAGVPLDRDATRGAGLAAFGALLERMLLHRHDAGAAIAREVERNPDAMRTMCDAYIRRARRAPSN